MINPNRLGLAIPAMTPLPEPVTAVETTTESTLAKLLDGFLDELEKRNKEQIDRIIEAIGASRVLKGLSVRVFDIPRQTDGISEHAVDCRGFNAVSVAVFVTGDTPSATITVKGADAAGGNYLKLPDSNAEQLTVSNDVMFDVVVGTAFVRIELSSVTGTFGPGQGYTVIVTPYVR